MNTELERLRTLFKETTDASIAWITTTSLSQQDIVSELSANTIENCTKLTADLQSIVDVKTTTLIASVADKVHEAEVKAIANHSESWSQMSKSMATTHAQLAKTNGVAIKNNAILSSKLLIYDARVKELQETIALQTATIENLSTMLDTIDTRMTTLKEKITPDYCELVDSTARTKVIALVNKHCADPTTTSSLHETYDRITQDKYIEIKDNAVKAFDKIAKDTETYIQSKAAGIIFSSNAAAHSTVPIVHPTESEPSRNRLFPDVDVADPSLFDIHSRNQGPQRDEYYQSPHDAYHETLPTGAQLKDHQYIWDTTSSNPQLYNININNFHKIKWSTKCANEMGIFTFMTPFNILRVHAVFLCAI